MVSIYSGTCLILINRNLKIWVIHYVVRCSSTVGITMKFDFSIVTDFLIRVTEVNQL